MPNKKTPPQFTFTGNPVRIDYYKNDDRVVVFIMGYAINQNDSTMHAANKLAKKLRQGWIPMVTYGDTIPKQEMIEVY